MVTSRNIFFQICRACFEKLLLAKAGAYPVGSSIWLTSPAEIRSGGNGHRLHNQWAKVVANLGGAIHKPGTLRSNRFGEFQDLAVEELPPVSEINTHRQNSGGRFLPPGEARLLPTILQTGIGLRPSAKPARAWRLRRLIHSDEAPLNCKDHRLGARAHAQLGGNVLNMRSRRRLRDS